MTRKTSLLLAGMAVTGLLALLGWTLYPASPAAEAETPSLPSASGSADLGIVNQYVELVPSAGCGPTEISPSQDCAIDVRKVVHNYGPYGPVDFQTLKTATAPPGCTITPQSHLERFYNVPVSVALVIHEPFTIRCNQPSWHTFTFDNVITITTPGVTDPNSTNNTWHTDWTIAAATQADLEVVSQSTVVWPSKINASENVPVTLRVEVRNNGPYGPVDADVQGWLSPPTDCTAQPSLVSNQVALAAGESKTIDEQFTIHCRAGGLRSFRFYNRIAAKNPHIRDPDLTNNEKNKLLASIKIEPNADVKITSQSFLSPPAEITVNENVDVTLQKHIHDNGPATLIDITISTTASAPADCSATPKNVPSLLTGVPASVDQVVNEIWTIRCSQPSTHSFRFDNAVASVYYIDPDLTNNQRSTVLEVKAIGRADVKIDSQALVSPPSEIDVSQNVSVTLRKHLHNGGPYGPVQVSISPSASAPPDCTATPAPGNPTSATLPQSTDVVVDEGWTIRCSKASSHTFSFNDSIAITSQHVTDSNTGNNSASTSLTVKAIGRADVRIDSQALVSPPSEIDVSQNVNVTLRKHLHNGGPYGPVDVSISPSASAPSDCTATAAQGNPTSATLPQSVDTVMDEVWSIHCSKASSHTFSFNNAIAVTTQHVTDTNTGNNSASTGLTVKAIGRADAGIDSQALEAPPSEINVNENVSVTLRKHLHNAGLYGPVDVSISPSASPPPDCTATPAQGNPTSATLPLSTDVAVDEGWTIRCSKASSHTFSFSNSVAITTQHVTDPDLNNNSASTGLTVEAIGRADVGISQELVSPPSEINASEDVKLTLRKHLHNAGPYGPVEVSVSPSVSAPPGCTATLESGPGMGAPQFTSFEYQAANPGTSAIIVGFDMNTSGNTCPGNGTTNCTLGEINPCVQVPSGGGTITADVFLNGLPQLAGQPAVGGFAGFQYHIDEKNGLPVGTLSGKIHGDKSVNLLVQRTKVTLQDFSDPNGTSIPSWDAVVGDVGDTEYNPPFTKGVLSRLQIDTTGKPDGLYRLTIDPPGTQFGLLVLDINGDDYCAPLLFNGSPNPIYVGCDIWDANASPDPYGLIAIGSAQCPAGPTPTPTPSPSPSPSATPTATPPATPTPTPTISPTPTPPPAGIVLPVSVETTVDESWTIHCSQPSTHSFSFDNTVAITSGHVSDDNPDNNSASTGLTVDVIAKADVQVVGVAVLSPPTAIGVSEDTNITVRSTLRNNGPYGPVNVEIQETPTSPPDCEISPAGPVSRQVNLPKNVDVTVDEPFTIHCSKKSTHTFTFGTDIVRIKELHVLDPVSNNSGSTQLTVAAWGTADLKVLSQQVASPPTQIPVSQDVRITLDEVIHNNGPYEPVDAVTETTVSAPPDCTVQPTTHTQQFYGVPKDVPIVHHEPFTIHCYQVSSHTFVFNSRVRVSGAELHLRDQNAGNDTARTELTVASVAQADVRIVSIGFVNPPTKIPLAQNVDVTLRKHMHNNGPRGPVNIAINATATAPTGCTITAKNVPSSLSNVPVSVDQLVDEVWTVRCTQEGLKTFVFTNSIDVSTLHVYDPIQTNNTSRKLLTVRDPSYPYWGDDICDGKDNDGDTVIDKGWDLNGNTIADCLDCALDTDGDTLKNCNDDDDDGDGWSDLKEGFMRTDPLNACPLDKFHDAWPPDINNDRKVNIADVILFRSPINGAYDRRYDLNTDGRVSIADVILYRLLLGRECTL